MCVSTRVHEPLHPAVCRQHARMCKLIFEGGFTGRAGKECLVGRKGRNRVGRKRRGQGGIGILVDGRAGLDDHRQKRQFSVCERIVARLPCARRA